MQYSKHSLVKRKQHSQHQKRTYNQNYHLQRIYHDDKNEKARILVSRCDLCNEQLPETPDNLNLQAHMNIINEIDDSFESDYDKSTYECGPKLILCDYCKKEYLLPAYE
jgi:predicted aldo/keto reductase-like oxidoreductase